MACECKTTLKKLQKKINIIGVTLIVTLVVALVGASVAIINSVQTSNSPSSATESITDIVKEGIKKDGVTYDGEDGKTALELLKSWHIVETKEYSGMGEYVTSIDHVAAEDGVNFWAFYVNGAMASEGASTYKTKSGEKIKWKLDAIQ